MSELIIPGNPNLALVGTHGTSELTGLALRESHLQKPVEGWDVIIANELAVAMGVRFVTHNMAGAFGIADPKSDIYEIYRPAELIELALRKERVDDIHDVPRNGGDFIAIGSDGNVGLLDMAALLGIQNVLVYKQKVTLPSIVSKASVLEFGRGTNDQLVWRNVERLRKAMSAVAVGDVPDIYPERFNYYERVLEISARRVDELHLQDFGYLHPFEPMPEELLERLQHDVIDLPPGEYVPAYWNGQSSDPDWYGDVLRKIPSPF